MLRSLYQLVFDSLPAFGARGELLTFYHRNLLRVLDMVNHFVDTRCLACVTSRRHNRTPFVQNLQQHKVNCDFFDTETVPVKSITRNRLSHGCEGASVRRFPNQDLRLNSDIIAAEILYKHSKHTGNMIPGGQAFWFQSAEASPLPRIQTAQGWHRVKGWCVPLSGVQRRNASGGGSGGKSRLPEMPISGTIRGSPEGG